LENIKEKIGKELRSIRLKKGLRQQDLAELYNRTDPVWLRVTQADISRYELGQVSIPAEKLEKFRMIGGEK
jgi:transcriptional regulator with XRE-family HTH domain